jgi:hypothetical protein
VEPTNIIFMLVLIAGLVLTGFFLLLGQSLGRKRLARYQAERVIRSAYALRKLAQAEEEWAPELSRQLPPSTARSKY